MKSGNFNKTPGSFTYAASARSRDSRSSGGIDGFASLAVHFPKEKITAAYIANASGYPMNNLLMGVIKIILGQEYELPNF